MTASGIFVSFAIPDDDPLNPATGRGIEDHGEQHTGDEA